MPVIIRKDRTKDVYAAIRSLTSKEVLIGIPAAAGDHKTPEGGQTSISKAAIGYILETGSPARNLPARPFLAPGVASYQDRAAKRLKTIGRKALDGDTRQIDQGLAAVGLEAVSSVRKKMTEGPFAPLAPSTLAARARRGVTRTKPLIDTGELLQAIQSVVADKGK